MSHRLTVTVRTAIACMAIVLSLALPTLALATNDPSPCTRNMAIDPNDPLIIRDQELTLLQPLSDDPCAKLPPRGGIQILFDYFNMAWPWTLGIASGISVIYAIFGGTQIMLFSDDSGKRNEGKGYIQWAIIGLLMIGLAGLILQTLNPLFYVQM